LIQPGLVSVTFRHLPTERVLELAVEAGLAAIEWGGDVHVPHGDLETAERVGRQTHEAGLATPVYGSYYRCMPDAPDDPDASAVVETAAALGAKHIRVWAGTCGGYEATEPQRDAIISDLQRICDLSAEHDMGVTLEYHADTLTDTADSCLWLLMDTNRSNLSTLWQPTNGATDAESLTTLRRVDPYVRHLHVFNWRTGRSDQTALEEGTQRWLTFLANAWNAPRDRFAMIEFVKDDDEAMFKRDAATLKRWLAMFKK
jgi:sugar phosphate isomerase/epimerase